MLAVTGVVTACTNDEPGVPMTTPAPASERTTTLDRLTIGALLRHLATAETHWLGRLVEARTSASIRNALRSAQTESDPR